MAPNEVYATPSAVAIPHSGMSLDEARGMALQSLWRKDLRHLADDVLAVEREHCSRRLAEACHAPDIFGDTMIPLECWQAIYGERIAWLDMETMRREKLRGLYERSETGFTREYVDNVLAHIHLAEFIAERHPTTRLKGYGGGSGWLGFCPWHDDQHKSLGVWDRPEWHWFCFTCLEGGDVLNWLLKSDAQGFREAVKKAAEHAGIAPPRIARGRGGF